MIISFGLSVHLIFALERNLGKREEESCLDWSGVHYGRKDSWNVVGLIAAGGMVGVVVGPCPKLLKGTLR